MIAEALCAMFFYHVGTHEPVPQATAYPVPCDSRYRDEAGSGQSGLYAIVRPVGPGFDVEAFRKQEGKVAP